MTEPLYRCHVCRLDWLEGQLPNDPPWAPRDVCPVCGRVVKRADFGDLPMFDNAGEKV